MESEGAGVVTLLVSGVELPEVGSADLVVEAVTEEDEALLAAAARVAMRGRPRPRFTLGSDASLTADPEPSAAD